MMNMEEGGSKSIPAVETSPTDCKGHLMELHQLKAAIISNNGWQGMSSPCWDDEVLLPILAGLRHVNSQVSLQALDCLLIAVPKLAINLTSSVKDLALTLGEVMGDSRPSVRERANEVLVLLIGKAGVGPVLEGLEPAGKHRNTRMRQEIAKFLCKIVKLVPDISGYELRLLEEQLAAFLADANSEVRAAALDGVERLFAQRGVEVIKELEAMGVRSTQLKHLTSPPPSKKDDAAAAGAAPFPSGGEMEAFSEGMNAEPATTVMPRRVQGGRNEKEAVVMEHVETVIELVPLKVHSERDLLQEMELVATGLGASEDQWQSRVEALQRLQQLAVGGAGKYESFVPSIKALHEGVSVQVCSLRSALSREGCTTVAVLAQVLSDGFAPLAELFAPSLLRMTQTNILIIAMTADQCLRCVVCCTRLGFSRLVTILVEGVGSKGDTERLRSIKAVTLALCLWEEPALERSVEQICRMIKIAVADKKEPVRTAARQCFWALRRKFPSAADGVMDGLDASRQKHLYKEQASVTSAFIDSLVPKQRFRVVSGSNSRGSPTTTTVAAGAPPMPEPPALLNPSTSSSDRASYHTHVAEPPLPPAPSSVRGGASRRQSIMPSGPLRVAAMKGNSSHGVGEGRSVAAAGLENEGSNGSMMMGGAEGGKGMTVSTPGGATRTAQRIAAKLPKAGGEDLNGRGSSSNGGLAQGPAVAPSSARIGGRLSMSGPMRVIRGQAPSTPQHGQQQQGGGLMRIRGMDDSSSNSFTASSSGGGEDQQVQVQQQQAQPPLPPSSSSQQQHLPRGERVPPPSTSGAGGRGGGVASWDSMIKEADNSAWSQRLQCFENVTTRLRGFADSSSAAAAAVAPNAAEEEQGGAPSIQPLASTPEEVAALGRVLSAILRHVNDAVFRVSQAALEALVELVSVRGGAEVLAPQLDHILPRLLTKLCDPKESLRVLANTALDRCREVFDPSALCASLSRVVHEQPDRSKAAGLEVLRAVIPSASTYLSHGPANRSLLTKLSAILVSRPNLSLQRATAACVLALYHVDPTAFVEHFASLAAEPQMAIRRILVSQASDWESRGGGATPSTHRGNNNGQSRSGSFSSSSSSASGAATAPQPSRPMSRTAPTEEGVSSLPAGGSYNTSSEEVQRGREVPRSVGPGTVVSRISHHHRSISSARKTMESSEGTEESREIVVPVAEAISRALTTLADRVALVDNQAEALKQLVTGLGRAERGIWDRYFGQTLHILLEKIREPSIDYTTAAAGRRKVPACPLLLPVYGEGGLEGGEESWASERDSLESNPRFTSLCGLHYLLSKGPDYFEGFLEVTLGRLLECATENYEIFQLSEKVIALLTATTSEPDRFYQVFVSFISDARAELPRLLVALRGLAKLLPRTSSPTLLASLPSLSPVLIRHINHQEIVLRLTIVTVVAEMYLVVGDALLPHLQAKLRPPQLKLVTIYINKQLTERSNDRASVHGGGLLVQ